MKDNTKRFFIFANGVLWDRFKKKGEEFGKFCKLVGQEQFGTLFMPEDRDKFYKDAKTVIIQLYFPGIIRYSDINGKRISASFIEGVINLRKVEVSHAVVIAASEKDFSDFDHQDEKLEFILLDEKRPTGKYVGREVSYTVIHNLMEAVAILESK